MSTEFEIVPHGFPSYNIFFVNMLYRTPHIHKDFEISLLLSGSARIVTRDRSIDLSQDDFWILNPFQSHEIIAEQPALLLLLQVSPSFFSLYYPQLENTDFEMRSISATGENRILRELMLRVADLSFRQPEYFEMRAAADINLLFYHLLTRFPNTVIADKEKNSNRSKVIHMRRIVNYIDDNFSQKLLLSDIAREEGLTLSYLSHFFREAFGLSFQTYLLKMRCEKARRLLLLTKLPLLDICIACGFSDMKYFNRGFREQYGCSPKEYRSLFANEKLWLQQESMLTTQDILSPNASLALLSRYYPPKE